MFVYPPFYFILFFQYCWLCSGSARCLAYRVVIFFTHHWHQCARNIHSSTVCLISFMRWSVVSLFSSFLFLFFSPFRFVFRCGSASWLPSIPFYSVSLPPRSSIHFLYTFLDCSLRYWTVISTSAVSGLGFGFGFGFLVKDTNDPLSNRPNPPPLSFFGT